MKHASVYLVGCLLLLAAAGTVTQAKEGGGVPERTMESLRVLLAEGVAAKAPRIVIPPGIYRGGPAPRPDGKASPDRAGSNVHVLIENLSDTEIIAEGVTLLCTDLTRAIMFRDCRKVELRGLTVDYDPLPFTQGDIVEVNGPEGWLDVKIHAGYPVRAQGRIDIVDRQTRFRRENTPFMWVEQAGTAQRRGCEDTQPVSHRFRQGGGHGLAVREYAICAGPHHRHRSV